MRLNRRPNVAFLHRPRHSAMEGMLIGAWKRWNVVEARALTHINGLRWEPEIRTATFVTSEPLFYQCSHLIQPKMQYRLGIYVSFTQCRRFYCLRLEACLAWHHLTRRLTLLALRTTYLIALPVVWINEWITTNQVAPSTSLRNRRVLSASKPQANW